MIELERIHMQHQENDKSYAVHSRKTSRENPGLRITRISGEIVWDLVGLRDGEIQDVEEDNPRATHIDFYIGMEDLIDQRDQFLGSIGMSIGIATDGLRNPMTSIREEGKPIRWERPIGRIQIESIHAILRPFSLTTFHDPSWINIDGESSPYPIISTTSHRQTTRQLHFGISQDDLQATRSRSRNPRCTITITEDQYSAILEAVDLAIDYYQTNIGRGRIV